MKYQCTTVPKWKYQVSVLIAVTLFIALILACLYEEPPLISPLSARASHDTQVVERDVNLPPCEGEKCEIMDYIVEVFEEDALDAMNVLKCENGNLNPNAVNYNRNGSRDLGVFQLNDNYWGGEENFDYKTNIDKAYTIFVRAGKLWTPWTCSHRVFQENYLGQ